MFHNVAGLISSAAVNVNGVRVGSVEKLTLAGKDKVLVAVKVNGEDASIPVGSQFDILSSGVVGAKYIEITLPQQNSDQKLPPLDEKTEVVGNDPVRIEVVVNKIAKQFDDFDFKEAHERVNEHMDTFARAADRIIVLTDKLTPAANHAAAVETKIGDLTTEMQGTSKRLNKFLDNPALTSDLKETAQKAKETAESINKTMHELNQTLANKPLRSDLLAAMNNLNQSTVNIRRSVESMQQITGDQSLRSDVKHIISSLNLTMDKADQMLTSPGFGTDMRGALGDVRDTVRHLDLAARQMNAILGQKHPLVHLIFGQPGSLKNAANAKAEMKSKQKIEKVIESTPSSSDPNSSSSPMNSLATPESATNSPSSSSPSSSSSSSSSFTETKTIENMNSEKPKKSAE